MSFIEFERRLAQFSDETFGKQIPEAVRCLGNARSSPEECLQIAENVEKAQVEFFKDVAEAAASSVAEDIFKYIAFTLKVAATSAVIVSFAVLWVKGTSSTANQQQQEGTWHDSGGWTRSSDENKQNDKDSESSSSYNSPLERQLQERMKELRERMEKAQQVEKGMQFLDDRSHDLIDPATAPLEPAEVEILVGTTEPKQNTPSSYSNSNSTETHRTNSERTIKVPHVRISGPEWDGKRP